MRQGMNSELSPSTLISLGMTLVSLVFVCGSVWSQFRASRSSLRDQGRRIGALELENVQLKTRLDAVERGRNGHEQ